MSNQSPQGPERWVEDQQAASGQPRPYEPGGQPYSQPADPQGYGQSNLPHYGAAQPASWGHEYSAAPYVDQPQYQRSSLAVPALILAICSLLCGGIFFALPASIVGWLEVRAIKEGRSDPSKRGVAIAATVIGAAVSLLSVAAIILYVVLAAANSSAAAS